MDEFVKIEQAAAVLADRIGTDARIGIVLGSGLGGLAASLQNATSVPFAAIPHFPPPRVAGHEGRIVAGTLAGVPVVCVQGRYHLYEGYPLVDVVRPVRVLGRLGVRTLVLTNACGAIRKTFAPGDLMLVSDHLNLTGTNPLVGPNLDALGPRFPDASAVYDPALRQLAREAAATAGISLQEGVYAWWTGPTYETPAEIRMLRLLGADAVGMSTVPEALAASHMGLRILAIACLTNMATGLRPEPLTHADVLAVAAAAADRLAALIVALVGSRRL